MSWSAAQHAVIVFNKFCNTVIVLLKSFVTFVLIALKAVKVELNPFVTLVLIALIVVNVELNPAFSAVNVLLKFAWSAAQHAVIVFNKFCNTVMVLLKSFATFVLIALKTVKVGSSQPNHPPAINMSFHTHTST